MGRRKKERKMNEKNGKYLRKRKKDERMTKTEYNGRQASKLTDRPGGKVGNRQESTSGDHFRDHYSIMRWYT